MKIQRQRSRERWKGIRKRSYFSKKFQLSNFNASTKASSPLTLCADGHSQFWREVTKLQEFTACVLPPTYNYFNVSLNRAAISTPTKSIQNYNKVGGRSKYSTTRRSLGA